MFICAAHLTEIRTTIFPAENKFFQLTVIRFSSMLQYFHAKSYEQKSSPLAQNNRPHFQQFRWHFYFALYNKSNRMKQKLADNRLRKRQSGLCFQYTICECKNLRKKGRSSSDPADRHPLWLPLESFQNVPQLCTGTGRVLLYQDPVH